MCIHQNEKKKRHRIWKEGIKKNSNKSVNNWMVILELIKITESHNPIFMKKLYFFFLWNLWHSFQRWKFTIIIFGSAHQPNYILIFQFLSVSTLENVHIAHENWWSLFCLFHFFFCVIVFAIVAMWIYRISICSLNISYSPLLPFRCIMISLWSGFNTDQRLFIFYVNIVHENIWHMNNEHMVRS